MSFGNSQRQRLLEIPQQDEFQLFSSQQNQNDHFGIHPTQWELNQTHVTEFAEDNQAHNFSLQDQDSFHRPYDHFSTYQYGEETTFNHEPTYGNFSYLQDHNAQDHQKQFSNCDQGQGPYFSVKSGTSNLQINDASSQLGPQNLHNEDCKDTSSNQSEGPQTSEDSLQIGQLHPEIANGAKLGQQSSALTTKVGGQKKGKTTYQNDLIQFISPQRKDVVVRSLLRLIRRYYQTRFNKITNYIKDKKRNGASYFLDQLDLYIDHLFKEKNKAVKKHFKEDMEFRQELQLFLGSMFYHKEMLKIFKDQETKHRIEVIRKSLYGFSIKSLVRLFKESGPFRFIIDHIQAHKQKVISLLDNEKVENAMPEDYETGFQFLSQLNDSLKEEQ